MVNTANSSSRYLVLNINIWKFMTIRSYSAESLFGRHGWPVSTPLAVWRLASDWTEARRLTEKWYGHHRNRSIPPTLQSDPKPRNLRRRSCFSQTGVILATVAMTNRLSLFLIYCLSLWDFTDSGEAGARYGHFESDVVWKRVVLFILSYIARPHRSFNECYKLRLCESCSWLRKNHHHVLYIISWLETWHMSPQRRPARQSKPIGLHILSPSSYLPISFGVVHAVNRLGGRR